MGVATIPILPSPEFDVTSRFWAGFGFTETGRWSDEYLILRNPDLAIEFHFWHDPDTDRWTNDVACYVRFDTPDEAVACHRRWADVPVPAPAVLHGPMVEPWGAVEFHVIDPHGNLVRFGGFPISD
jgi:hypothetical protein